MIHHNITIFLLPNRQTNLFLVVKFCLQNTESMLKRKRKLLINGNNFQVLKLLIDNSLNLKI